MVFVRKLLGVVLLASLAFAGGVKDGKFYVGVGAGVNSPSVDNHLNDNGLKFEMTLGKADIIYGANIGWRFFVDKGFHGAEISVKNSNAEGSYKISSLGGGFKTNESYELSYKGGYALAKDTYVTGRVGYGVLKISHFIEGSLEVKNGTFDHSINALITGLGIEHYLEKNIALGAEYVYRHSLEDIKHRHMYLDNSGDYTDIKGDFSDHSFVVFMNYFF